jgi:[ribosomal protein S5]-alanine N-acetyltransferase
MFDFSRLLLTTPRLTLRPLCPADAATVFALHADPVGMRYWATPPWDDPVQADTLIAQDQAGLAAGDFIRLGLERRHDGRLVGLCSLFAFQLGSRRAETGYMLARDCWGGGLMHEALQALLDYGFGVLDLNRVEADIDTRNSASERTLRRLGFQQEGTLRERWIVAGEVSDTGLYGLLRRDWRARGAAAAPPQPR